MEDLYLTAYARDIYWDELIKNVIQTHQKNDNWLIRALKSKTIGKAENNNFICACRTIRENLSKAYDDISFLQAQFEQRIAMREKEIEGDKNDKND